MSIVFPDPVISVVPVQTGRIASAAGVDAVGAFRLPTDPLFLATLTLRNVVTGSRYRVTRNDNGDELAAGVAAGSTVTLTGIPCYSDPMLVDITVRKASAAPFYKSAFAQAEIPREGTQSFIFQIAD